MKRIFFAAVLALGLTSCNDSNRTGNNVSIETNDVPGFNVQNFAALAKTTSNASDIEAKINASGNNINNLDLNKDGNTDFLKVDESDKTITVIDNDVNPTVTVCTMTVTAQGTDQAVVNVQGSPQYCGSDYNYHSTFSFTDYLLLSYMLRPHMYYHPMYGYGYHPAYYHSYRPVTRTVTHTYRSNSNSNYKSSGSGYSYKSSTRSSLSSPTTSQRSFTKTSNNDGGYRPSGFGKSSSTGFGKSSSGGGGRSSFGSGKSSFGGRSGKR